MMNNAITALRAALEGAKEVEPVAWVTPTAYLVSTGRNSLSAWSGVKTDAHTIPLYTHPAPAVPEVKEGWQLVPKEPTPEMSAAFYEANPSGWGLPHSSYKAMLQAAPKL